MQYKTSKWGCLGGGPRSVRSKQSSEFYVFVLSRVLPMGLIVALDDSNSATGSLFWDDGESLGQSLFYIIYIII